MIGVYFSGTGNTKYCVEHFVHQIDPQSIALSMEEESVVDAIKFNDTIVFGYPVQYSTLPMIVRDFVTEHSTIWNGKHVFVIATMALFSGDGAGVLSRLLAQYGAKIVGGVHVRMPDSICDEKVLKKSVEENRRLVVAATQKLDKAAEAFQNHRPPQDGLAFYHRILGFLGQRLLFRDKIMQYKDQIKIDPKKCCSCQKCISLCPMGNLIMKEDRIVPQNRCTLCYRCISQCPKKAITLLGTKVIEQCYLEKYR